MRNSRWNGQCSAHVRNRKALGKHCLLWGKPIKAFLKTDRANGKMARGGVGDHEEADALAYLSELTLLLEFAWKVLSVSFTKLKAFLNCFPSDTDPLFMPFEL